MANLPYVKVPLADHGDDDSSVERLVIRTPSPTLSESEALTGKSQRAAIFKKENFKFVLTLGILLTLIVLLLVYKNKIVEFLQPAAKWMHDTPGGWAIPVGALVVLSVPPLLGHEIVLILCGFTWGMGVGFGISAAGVFIGEVLVFYIFKWFCAARGERMERESISYATLARVLREGGLKVAIIARWSAIPPHLLTGILAICGMNIWTFSIAAVVALPRQAVLVFIGYAMRSSEDADSQKLKHAIEYGALALKIAITVFAMYYVRKQEAKVLSEVIYERRKRRQERRQMLVDHGVVEEGGEFLLAPIPRTLHSRKITLGNHTSPEPVSVRPLKSQ